MPTYMNPVTTMQEAVIRQLIEAAAQGAPEAALDNILGAHHAEAPVLLTLGLECVGFSREPVPGQWATHANHLRTLLRRGQDQPLAMIGLRLVHVIPYEGPQWFADSDTTQSDIEREKAAAPDNWGYRAYEIRFETAEDAEMFAAQVAERAEAILVAMTQGDGEDGLTGNLVAFPQMKIETRPQCARCCRYLPWTLEVFQVTDPLTEQVVQTTGQICPHCGLTNLCGELDAEPASPLVGPSLQPGA